MSLSDTRKAFEVRFEAVFGAANPTVTRVWENVNYRSPDGSPWVRAALREGEAEQVSINDQPIHRHEGVFILQVFGAEHEGQEVVMDLADSAASAFRGTLGKALQLSNGSSGTITVRSPSFRVIGLDRGWFQVNVLVLYRRDVQFS
jgi:hypothetical protein